MITLVRNQDVVILLPATVYFLISKSAGLKTSALMEKLNRVVLFWSSVFLVMSIQLFVTLDLYGKFGSPYIIGGEQLSWFRPDFIRVLFSFGNGLFTFAPILVVAVVGLVWVQNSSFKDEFRKKKIVASLIKKLMKLAESIMVGAKINNYQVYRYLSLIALFSLLLQLYVVASWGREIIGGPYGSRMFISVLPHLVLGLAFILNKHKKRKRFDLVIMAGLGFLFMNNLVQTAIMLVRF